MLFRPPNIETSLGMRLFIVFIALCIVVPIILSITTFWGMTNLAYELTDSHFSIVYGPRTIKIDRSSITNVTVIDQPTRGRRHVGTNMGGFKQGKWSFEETGPINLYSTYIEPLTVIETSDEKWGISPDDPVAFVTTFQSGGSARFPPVPSRSTGGFVAVMIFPFILVVFAAWSAFYVIRMKKNLSYELRSTGIHIYGGLRPKVIPYEKITDVTIETPEKKPIRSMGVSIPGLFWGSFSWRGIGSNVKLYATKLSPIVFIKSGRQTHGLSPEDPDAFVERLKEKVRLKP